MINIKKSYLIIPIMGIVLTIISAMYSFYNEIDTNFELLDEFDFTGETSIFLILIVIINIVVLSIYLYFVIKGKRSGFNFKLNKIFTVMFFILTIISIVSFIYIRNKEEKISLNYTNGKMNIKNNTIYVNLSDSKISSLQNKDLDKYSKIKINIANEVQSINSKVDRYISLISHYWVNNHTYIIPTKEQSYYSIIIRFVILEFTLCLSFAYHIKDEYFEQITRIKDVNN